jgi:hypothetical protein
MAERVGGPTHPPTAKNSRKNTYNTLSITALFLLRLLLKKDSPGAVRLRSAAMLSVGWNSLQKVVGQPLERRVQKVDKRYMAVKECW